MKTIHILLLEDDLQTLALLLHKLHLLEKRLESNSQPAVLAITALSEYTQVAEYVNTTTTHFDIILLDRDCKAGGSFHVLDFTKFDSNTIIGISSVPEYNKQLQCRGISRIVWKDYTSLSTFANRVIRLVKEMIQ